MAFRQQQRPVVCLPSLLAQFAVELEFAVELDLSFEPKQRR